MPKIHFYNIQALGAGLKTQRRQKKLEPEKVSKDLGIPLKYLEAMEDGRFFDLPNEKYAKKATRFYCRYLNLDHEGYWKEIKRFQPFAPISQNIKGWDFWHWHAIGRKVLIWGTVLLVLIFLGFSVERIFAAPRLEITSPKTLDLRTTDNQIEVVGKSQKEAEILVNNKEFFVDKDGIFKAPIDLQSGLNFIKIEAKKKYGRTSDVLIRVLVKKPGGN